MSTLRTDDKPRSKAEEVKSLYDAGWPVVRIANALGISPQGVYWHLDRLGLPAPTRNGADDGQED